MNLSSSRIDYFLIWGHGLAFRDQIIAMIREHRDLSILRLLSHVAEDVDHLVDAVYSYDYAPIQHLAGKTEYLRNTPREVFFVFVENRRPDEDYFGDAAYRHIESNSIKALKERIRDAWNPRIAGRRSEDHVIHASDNQLQTDHILRYLGFPGVEMFENRHLALAAPYHLEPLTDYSITRIPVSSLRCRILTGDRKQYAPRITQVEETPHFRALAGDGQPYRDYLSTFMGEALADDHTLAGLLALRDSLRYLESPHEVDYIVVRKVDDVGHVVMDGVHRAAVLRFRGVEEIHVAEVSEP